MPSAYDELLGRLHKISAIAEAAGVLHWDQEVMMPPGGVEARAAQLATLSSLAHEWFASEATGRALAQAEKDVAANDIDALANLRETRFAYDRATKVPTQLVEALSRAQSQALPAWTKARAASDFGLFRDHLAHLIELRREYAAAIAADAPAYEVLFQDYEPWLSLADTRRNLTTLRDGLKPLVDKHLAARDDGPSPLDGAWGIPAQDKVCREVLTALGYDFEHGRLDISAHPFSTGNPYDARITTRFDERDLLSSLSSTIHEFGHSLYTQGLPREHFGTPLGDARDLAVHESQSRLWENHVGRSLPFMHFLLPKLQAAFPGRLDEVDAETMWRASNRVRPTLIRVEADELTYHQHIAVRFEVEEAMMSGKASVDEVPAIWNERYQALLGVTPTDDAHGCLQDIHWAHGSMGYFPTYSLGSMLAAQLFARFEKEHGAYDSAIAAGDFAALRNWLREHVHQQGKRYETNDLVRAATGSDLAPDAFLAYAQQKFGQ